MDDKGQAVFNNTLILITLFFLSILMVKTISLIDLKIETMRNTIICQEVTNE